MDLDSQKMEVPNITDPDGNVIQVERVEPLGGDWIHMFVEGLLIFGFHGGRLVHHGFQI